MESLLSGIKNVAVYLDDILVAGQMEEEHLVALETVLNRINKSGLRMRLSKCAFMQSSVSYLGHVISQKGLQPLPNKVQAIQGAPIPSNIHQLKSYLGLLTYYNRFLPNMSSTLAPLYLLLRKGQPWSWGKEQQSAFDQSKTSLSASSFLTHFDSNLPILLACDASAYGIGAVLAHRTPEGGERPIGYVSRTLNSAERNYSQLEKEGLACIFGIKKFHSYLLGHPFELITDHRPLLSLFKETGPIPAQASARIRRWSLFLSLIVLRIPDIVSSIYCSL